MQRIDSQFHLENDSIARSDDWWKWSVWVEGPEHELDDIEHVTYRLHPTFPQPVRSVTDRATKFQLESAGWGEFSISAVVRMRSGEDIRLERWLQLGQETVSRAAAPTRPFSAYVSHGLVDGPLVNQLSDALAAQNIEVTRLDSAFNPGTALEEAVGEHLRAADAVVPIISKPPNQHVLDEARRALADGRLVLPVIVANADTPPALSRVLRFKLGEEQNVAELANRLASRIKDHMIED